MRTRPGLALSIFVVSQLRSPERELQNAVAAVLSGHDGCSIEHIREHSVCFHQRAIQAVTVLFRYAQSGFQSWLIFALDGSHCYKVRATATDSDLAGVWSVLIQSLEALEQEMMNFAPEGEGPCSA